MTSAVISLAVISVRVSNNNPEDEVSSVRIFCASANKAGSAPFGAIKMALAGNKVGVGRGVGIRVGVGVGWLILIKEQLLEKKNMAKSEKRIVFKLIFTINIPCQRILPVFLDSMV